MVIGEGNECSEKVRTTHTPCAPSTRCHDTSLGGSSYVLLSIFDCVLMLARLSLKERPIYSCGTSRNVCMVAECGHLLYGLTDMVSVVIIKSVPNALY